MRSYSPVVFLKILESRTKWAAKSDRSGGKAIPFGAAHTYITYIREYPGYSTLLMALNTIGSSQSIFGRVVEVDEECQTEWSDNCL